MASRGGDKYAGVSTALGMVAGGMEERRKRREEFEAKVQTVLAERAIEGGLFDRQIGIPEPKIPQAGNLPGQYVPKYGARGEVTGYEFIKDKDEKDRSLSQDKAGLATLAAESVKNIRDVKRILFPSGTASSFNRGVATAANVPGSGLPLIPDTFSSSQEGQDVARKTANALAGRQLIQTGVAARPEETQKLYKSFAPGLFTNAQSALNGFNELELFYKNYLNSLQTGEFPTGSQFEQPSSSQSGRSDGKLMIDANGNRAIVYPDGSYEEIP